MEFTLNPMAIILYVLGGITILSGFLLGLDAKDTTKLLYSDDSDWTAFFIWFGPGIITGVILLGMGEIIRILDVKKKTLQSTLDIEETKKQDHIEEQTEQDHTIDKTKETMDSWKKYQ